jgi:hypothetical protein
VRKTNAVDRPDQVLDVTVGKVNLLITFECVQNQFTRFVSLYRCEILKVLGGLADLVHISQQMLLFELQRALAESLIQSVDDSFCAAFKIVVVNLPNFIWHHPFVNIERV